MKIQNSIGFIFIIAVLFLMSCDQSVYRKWEKKSFPDYVWKVENEIVFEPSIEDINRNYNIILGIRHVYGINISELPVRVRIVTPSGGVQLKNYVIRFEDEKGRSLAECSGSLCDIETEVEPEFVFHESGQYRFIVHQNSHFPVLKGIMELGLIIK